MVKNQTALVKDVDIFFPPHTVGQRGNSQTSVLSFPTATKNCEALNDRRVQQNSGPCRYSSRVFKTYSPGEINNRF